MSEKVDLIKRLTIIKDENSNSVVIPENKSHYTEGKESESSVVDTNLKLDSLAEMSALEPENSQKVD